MTTPQTSMECGVFHHTDVVDVNVSASEDAEEDDGKLRVLPRVTGERDGRPVLCARYGRYHERQLGIVRGLGAEVEVLVAVLVRADGRPPPALRCGSPPESGRERWR
jgi:hypothetical protein